MKRRNFVGMFGAFVAGVLPFGLAQADEDDEPRRASGGRVVPFGRKVAEMAAVVLTRDATEVQVVDTTTETDVFSYTIPAGAFGTDRAVRLQVAGTVRNGSAGTVVYTISIKLGATTVFSDDFQFGSGTTIRPWTLDVVVSQIGVNDQFLYGTWMRGGGAADTAGLGDTAGSPAGGAIQGDAAEDEATDLTLAVTIEMDTADADAEVVKRFATLELL